jgi:D-3-phosphoglycerate dehydrogenase / 2-oxoglutarate reductase
VTRPLIAVTDSVFPSLEPAMAALKRLDPEIRVAKSTSEADILAVARDADGVLVTYAKLPGELLRQLRRCKVIGRFIVCRKSRTTLWRSCWRWPAR